MDAMAMSLEVRIINPKVGGINVRSVRRESAIDAVQDLLRKLGNEGGLGLELELDHSVIDDLFELPEIGSGDAQPSSG